MALTQWPAPVYDWRPCTNRVDGDVNVPLLSGAANEIWKLNLNLNINIAHAHFIGMHLNA